MSYILIFLILALLTGGLSFGGFLAASAGLVLVKILFAVFLIGLVGSVIMSLLGK